MSWVAYDRLVTHHMQRRQGNAILEDRIALHSIEMYKQYIVVMDLLRKATAIDLLSVAIFIIHVE